MMHTAHIAKFYWTQWRRSGGELDANGCANPKHGNIEWFSNYWLECEASYFDAMAAHRRPWH